MGKLLFEAFIVYIIIQVVFMFLKSNSTPKKAKSNTVFNNTPHKPKSTTNKDDGDFVDYEEVN